jgi:hypothetical protein
MKEIWKDIEEYEGLYQVSNLGRVKSIEKRFSSCGKPKKIAREKILKERETEKGYVSVMLCRSCNKKQYRIHRLVAQAFIKNTGNKPFINHLDGNRKNNNSDNIEWVTHKENMQYSFFVRGRSDQRNISLVLAKRIKKLFAEGKTVKEVNTIFPNLSYSLLRYIKVGYTWKHI